jgi:RNA polymerase sigma factor (sigma-70 family)
VSPTDTIQRSIKTLFQQGTLAGKSDGQLLTCFLASDGIDADEAFRILVARHGPMVLGVCRGILGPGEDVDDAFQATFLILIRKAASIRMREAVGPWLHGAAVQVARKLRSNSLRRRSRERPLEDLAAVPDPKHSCGDPERLDLIHDELARLPDRYRVPLILCCLEGLSYERAAHELGLSEPALRGRLHRGRRKLERRLWAKGFGLHSLLAAWRSRLDLSPTSLALQGSTVRLARSSPVHAEAASSGFSASTVSLAEGVMQTMFWSSFKAATLASVMTASLAGAIALAQQDRKSATRSAAPPAKAEAPLEKAVQKSNTPFDPKEMVETSDADSKSRRILDLLDQKIPLQLPPNTTLEDFLKAIKKATTKDDDPGIPIYVNPFGLQEAKQTMGTAIEPPGSEGGPIGPRLGMTLRALGLAYVVRDGFLMVDSRLGVLEQRSELLEQKLDRILKVLATRQSLRQN